MTSDNASDRFDALREAAKRAVAVHNSHILADFVAHAPCRLVSHTDLALDFLCRHAAAGRAELEHDKEPVAKASARPVERGASGRVDLMAAPFASVAASGFDAIEAGILAALFAIVTLTETDTHQMI